jgi:hypothetical protein
MGRSGKTSAGFDAAEPYQVLRICCYETARSTFARRPSAGHRCPRVLAPDDSRSRRLTVGTRLPTRRDAEAVAPLRVSAPPRPQRKREVSQRPCSVSRAMRKPGRSHRTRIRDLPAPGLDQTPLSVQQPRHAGAQERRQRVGTQSVELIERAPPTRLSLFAMFSSSRVRPNGLTLSTLSYVKANGGSPLIRRTNLRGRSTKP